MADIESHTLKPARRASIIMWLKYRCTEQFSPITAVSVHVSAAVTN